AFDFLLVSSGGGGVTEIRAEERSKDRFPICDPLVAHQRWPEEEMGINFGNTNIAFISRISEVRVNEGYCIWIDTLAGQRARSQKVRTSVKLRRRQESSIR